MGLESDLETGQQHVVVDTGFASTSDHRPEILGGVAVGIETAVEFALAVGITVVVDILVVERNLGILSEIEVEACAIEFSGTAKDGLICGTAFIVVHVDVFIFACEFNVTPATAVASAVELGAT